MKLFIVVNVDWFFLSHRKDVAVRAMEQGYDVTIVTKDTGKRAEIENLGLKYINLPMSRSGKNLFEELSVLRFLMNLYRKNKDAIFHHVGLKTILWGSLASKLVGVKGVVNAVSGLGIFFSQENKSLMSYLMIKTLKYAHDQDNLSVIFQNNEDKSLFINNKIIQNNQSRFIKGSGVDLSKYNFTKEISNDKTRIIFTARMIREKGVFILSEASKILYHKFNGKIEFILCGGLDDNPLALKEDEIKALCVEGYFTWLGYRTDIKELLESSHIVAFPSYYKEGLPKSLIEACAIGRPIVTTNSIGCRDAVIDGYNGFLIPVKNSKVLADKLAILIEDTGLRHNMGINARKYAEENFSLEEVLKRHMTIYGELSHKN